MKRELALQINLHERLIIHEALRREYNRILRRKMRKDERPSEKVMELATIKKLFDVTGPEEGEL